MATINKSSSWKALNTHFEKTKSIHMRDLFSKDINRFKNFHIQYDEPSGNDSGAKRAYSPFEMILFDYANANTRTPVYFAGGTVYSTGYTSGVYGGLIYCMGINTTINAVERIKFELADGGYFSKHTKISLYGLDG